MFVSGLKNILHKQRAIPANKVLFWQYINIEHASPQQTTQQGDTGGTQKDWSIYRMLQIQANLSITLFTSVATKGQAKLNACQ